MDKIDNILTERGSRYGEFPEVSMVAQNIKAAMRHSRNWRHMPADMKESLEMVANKMGRILTGDFEYADNVIDIIGYMQLVLNRMERTSSYAKDKMEKPGGD
jgi:hypothetical protein